MNSRILYTKPSITELEVGYATDAAQNGWGDKCYDYILKFEEMFKNFVGAKYAISTSSCTGALHMALAALGIKSGDEVIMADTNWIATAGPITYLGAKPVFVDVLQDTWCLDPNKVEAAITKNTKAIIAVHIYGNVCDLDRLIAIGKKYNIPLIEDAAEGIGSYWGKEHVGTIGLCGVFSFHGTKTITTGEGGMFVTNDAELYDRVLTLSNHGRKKGQVKQFWADVVGFKYKMSNVQAAIGCGQLERIVELVEKRRFIFNYYHAKLGKVNSISMNPELNGTTNGFWMPTIVYKKNSKVTRESLQAAFKGENIDARVFFWPLSSLPMFQPQPENTWAYDIPTRAINLPSYHDLNEEELDRVIKVAVGILNG